MSRTGTDRSWEYFGKHDPYFGVIAHDRYHRANLTDAAKEEFFRSGYEYVTRILATIREHLDPDFTVTHALDFGCGVGRLVVPLSEVAERVTGIDVSESMLREAKKNCDARSITNVELLRPAGRSLALSRKCNLINSFIVFQHIPVRRGVRIFRDLISHLEDGGVGVFHFTYANNSAVWSRFASFVKSRVPLATRAIDAIKGKSVSYPEMQMNSYDLNRLLQMVQAAGVREFYAEFTDHGGHLGLILYFQKRDMRTRLP